MGKYKTSVYEKENNNSNLKEKDKKRLQKTEKFIENLKKSDMLSTREQIKLKKETIK